LFTTKRLGTLSLHCPKRKVIVAQLLASCAAFLYKAQDTQSSNRSPSKRSFMHFMHLNLPMFYNHHNHDGNVIIIPFVIKIHEGDPLRGPLFALIHFRALCSITNHFPFCLFPSIINDIHIINPLSTVLSTYALSNSTLCDRSLYLTSKMCSMVPL
jgi:hypothetical protein